MIPELIPAILTENPVEARRKLGQLLGVVEWVQIDVTDGKFVPEHSIQAEDLTADDLEGFNVEVHLMVEDPGAFLLPWQQRGAHRVILPFETLRQPEAVFERSRELGLEIELGLNPETPFERLEPYLDAVDGVLFLSVVPGAQGHLFLPEVLEKVRTFRRAHEQVPVTIDGGVNETNMKTVVATGIHRIVIGSGIFQDPADPEHHLKRLRALLNR